MKYIDLLPFIIVCYGHSCSGAEETFLSNGGGTRVLFEIHRANKTRSDAQERCLEKNGTLVEINNEATQANLQSFIKTLNNVCGNGFWIGLKKRNVWKWATGGCNMSYTAWAQGAPNDRDSDKNHAILWGYQNNRNNRTQIYTWKDVSGNSKFINGTQTKYICQSEKNCVVLTKCTTVNQKCLYTQNKCFYFGGNELPESQTGVTWTEAKQRCDEIEDHGIIGTSPKEYPWSLACIGNKEVQNDLKIFLVRNYIFKGNYWISAEKSKTKQWKWESGKNIEWTNWYSGSPTERDNKHCVEMGNSDLTKFQWINAMCEEQRSFICQYDSFSSWSTWNSWSSCNNTCGTGVKIRNRTCQSYGNNPRRQTCVLGKNESEDEHQSCRKRACAVNGGWSSWSEWSRCSQTCGNAVRTRSRRCNNPSPVGSGTHCQGNNTGSIACKNTDCPVNGYWSGWGAWTSCSVSCGTGVRERTRKCDYPKPQHGGLYCKGENKSRKYCGSTTCSVQLPFHTSTSLKNTVFMSSMSQSTPSMNSQVVSPTARYKSETYFSTQTSSTGVSIYQTRQPYKTLTVRTYERVQSDDASKALVATLSSGSDTLYQTMSRNASSLFATIDGQNILTQQKSAPPNTHTTVSVDLVDGHTTVFGSLLSENDFVASASSVFSHLSSELEVTATSEVEENTSILTETGNQLLPSDNTIELTGTISNHGIEFHENDSDTDNTPSLNFYTLFSSEQKENKSLFGSREIHISSGASELLDSMYSTKDQGGRHFSSTGPLGNGPSSTYSPKPATMSIDMGEYSLSTISKDQLCTSSPIYLSTMLVPISHPVTGSYGGVTPTALPGDSELSSSALVPSLHTTSQRFDQNSNHGITTTQHMTRSSLDYLDLQPSMQTQTSSGNVVALDISFTTDHHSECLTYASLIDTTSENIVTNTILQGSLSGVYKASVLDVITFESLFVQESEWNHRVKQTDLLTSNNSEVTGNIITNGAELSSEQITPTKVTSHKSNKTERRISSTTSWSVMSNTILQPSGVGEIIELTKETESLGMQKGVLDSRSEANMTLSYQGVDMASLTTPMTTVSSSLLQAETGTTSISIQQSRNEAIETSSIISPTKVLDKSIHLGTNPFSSNSALATFEKTSAVSDMNTDTSSGTLRSYSSISIEQNKNETKVTSSVISPTKVWDESIHLGTDPFSSNSALGTFDTTKASVVSDIDVDTSSGILTTTQSTEKSSKYPVYQWALIGLSGILVPVLIVVGTFVYCCKRYCRNLSKEEVTDTGVTHASQVWYDNVMYESNTERVHTPGHRISRLEIIHNQRIQSMVLRKDQPLHKEDQNSSQQQVSHSPQCSDPQKNLKQKSLSVIMDQHYKSDRKSGESRISSPLSRKRYSEIQYPMSFHESKSAAPPRRPQTMIQSPYKYSRTRRVETLYIEEEGGILLPYGDVEGCDPIPDYDDIRVIPQPDY